ncbi:hypothetical protein Bca4012_092374 [Brassica carinata]|uniref:(rape) hypothetical protein n=1 Tax=Brassica napus TaxID=3708 RepID=A0A816UCS2_BRANA|nr:unnamed protein product [Brassica napus]
METFVVLLQSLQVGLMLVSCGEKKKEGSYRYWVREATADAAPPPQPRKLTNNDVVASNAPALGSLWNQAGTWEMVQFIK